jgi:hypothetical protein
MRKQLAYSGLTDEVFYLDGKSQKTTLPKGNFIQMVLLWLNEGNTPKVGEKFERTLSVRGVVHWKITCERISDGGGSNL